MTSWLFNFSRNPYSVENFNIRVAIDIIHNKTATDTFLTGLNASLLDMYDAMVVHVHHVDAISGMNASETNSVEQLLLTLGDCLDLYKVIQEDYVVLKQMVQTSSIPLQHQHFEVDQTFFR